jgi:hypothetical protein
MNAAVIKFNALTNTVGATASYNNFFSGRADGLVGLQGVAHMYEIGQKYRSIIIFTNF